MSTQSRQTTRGRARTPRLVARAALAVRVALAALVLLGAFVAEASSSTPAPHSSDDWFQELPTPAGDSRGSNAEATPAEPMPGAVGASLRKASPRDGWGYAIPMVRLTGGDHNVLRRGPGDAYAIVAVQPKGAEYRVIAKSADWYNVQINETTTGWIHESLCEEFEDLSHLEMRPNPRLFSRTGAFTMTGYAGGYAYDRKSNSFSLGGRLGYYVFDFVEVEGGVSWTHIHRPAEIVESLFGLSLEAEDFHMLFYNLGLRVEVLPGRQMVPYLVGGVGASILQGRTESAFHYGGGTSLFVNKTTAVRWELRAFRFDAGFDRARRTNHNVEFSLGTTVLF